MAQSGMFLPTKLNSLHSNFNNYLLKHGNIFMKPEIATNGFQFPFFSGDLGYHSTNDALFKGISTGIAQQNGSNADMPLDFVIKHEKPPTPPASTSPVGSKPPTPSEDKNGQQLPSDNSKNSIWVLGKQKLSWDNSTVASYNPETKMFRCVVCNAVGFLSRIAEHYLGTHTSAKVFQCLHCPYSSTWSRCVRMHMAKHHGVPNAPPSLWKGQPLLEEIFQLLTNLKTTVDTQGRDRVDPELSDKKFVCPKCPYTTDRRDLYLRHENIHKEDKPYHCYICFKLFNRADHVKKHFLRIHRGHPYDISLVRRRPPRSSTSASQNDTKTPNGLTKLDSKNSVTAVGNGNVVIPNGIDKSSKHEVTAHLQVPPTKNHFHQAKGFECPFCSWEGVDAWCLRRHMNVHIKSFECPICEFKSSKAERLFTHVYKIHQMLVCTKCKFVTDQANHFETHIKDCCVEIVAGPLHSNSYSDENPNDSDTMLSSPGLKRDTTTQSSTPNFRPTIGLQPPVPNHNKANFASYMDHLGRISKHQTNMKGSLSIIPLHNSVSFCFPSQPTADGFDGADIPCEAANLKREINSFQVDSSVQIKKEMSSPVQSSSDSGLADVSNDPNDLDLTCWHCGCEFADESSLNTHTEMYHSDNTKFKKSDGPSYAETTEISRVQKNKKKFSCTLCNFSSNEQRTILDHMRYHTGEQLICRAGQPCAFATIFDSTLSEHVSSQHADGEPRCPHCGFPCVDRVSFIRHYRKCHHSTSCYRCRSLKHSFQAVNSGSPTLVQPYLHHNPYSKKNIVALPSMKTNNTGESQDTVINPRHLNGQDYSGYNAMLNSLTKCRSRKQSMPRKLIPLSPQPTDTKSVQLCDKAYKARKEAFLKTYRRKLVRKGERPYWFCRKCCKKALFYRNRINFHRHCLWAHHGTKFRCATCKNRFRYKYQVLIHKRNIHSSTKFDV